MIAMVRLMLVIAIAACGGGDKHAAQPPPPAAPPIDAAPPPSTAMPDECVQYVASIDRMSGCAKLTPDARNALGDAKQAIVGAFANVQLTPEALGTMAGACKQGNDAIQPGLVALGC